MKKLIQKHALSMIATAALTTAFSVSACAHEGCVPEGAWFVPGSGRIAAQDILKRATDARIVLLGESHESPDDHRWELQTLAELQLLHPKLVIGFEMFPRRVQPVLDRWVAGELNQDEFLKLSDWTHVWGYDADYYLPLFQFARMNRIPMVALNVDQKFVRAVNAKGLAAVPVDEREGVTDPAPAGESYLKRLFDAYSQHPEFKHPAKKDAAPARNDPEFQRFVQAQLVWDRAMAQALAEAAKHYPDALVVGVMGARHVAHGDGVQHQLESLGIQRVATLLTWDHETDCKHLSADLASAVYGLPYVPPAPPPPPPTLLGIRILPVPEGIRVVAVASESIAEACGLKPEDIIVEAAGKKAKQPEELKAIVTSMVPGTWLPLKVKRGDEQIALTAKFPPSK